MDIVGEPGSAPVEGCNAAELTGLPASIHRGVNILVQVLMVMGNDAHRNDSEEFTLGGLMQARELFDSVFTTWIVAKAAELGDRVTLEQ